MPLTQGLHRAVQRHPDKLALRHLGPDDRAHTYAQLAAEVARHAAALRGRGVAEGDRVALLAPNTDRLVIQVLACWWLGAVPCPLNLRWSVPELAAALADAQPRLLIADDGQLAAAREAAAQAGANSPAPGDAPPVTVLRGELLAVQSSHFTPVPDVRAGGDDLAALLYTGGTTGRAKGVMLSHGNFWASAMSRGAELNNPPEGVSLLVAPLFHVAGLGRLIGQLIVGGTCLTLPQFRPEAALAAIAEHHVTDIIVVPSMLQMLMDHPSFDATRLQSLNRIAFGAAPMPPDLLDRALAAWPRAEFFQAYGMTETAASVCINPPANHRPEARAAGLLSSVGRAGLGAEILVVDESGNELPRGEVGEIVVRGPMVMQGYWNQPEATAAALREGWMHTGDAGRMDEQGWLWVVDRLKDMIITGGENVYSVEVETALRSHPAVADAAVVGVPDERWGEAVQAVVVLKAGQRADEAALLAHCRERLAGYKCPRGVLFTDLLPMSAAGKVSKATLRAAFAPTPGAAGPSGA